MLFLMNNDQSKFCLSRLIISAEEIKEYRASLMGVAILCVMLFHAMLNLPVFSRGYLGVDIFMFLSAIGLCYSLEKKTSLKDFYKKRIVRIVPTWWLAMSVALVLGALVMHRAHPANIGEFLLCFFGIGYWVQSAFDRPLWVVYYEWYVPTLLLFYILFPLLFKCKAPFLGAFLVMTEVLVWYCYNNHGFLPWEITWLTLPRFSVFLYGILYYRCCLLPCASIKNWLFVPLLILFGVLVAAGCNTEHYYVMLLLPICLKLLCLAIRLFRLTSVLSFFGTITLELYLVHMYWNIREFSIGPVTVTRYMSILPQIFICVVAALALRACVRKLQCIVPCLQQLVREGFNKSAS